MLVNENVIEVRNIKKTFRIYHERRNTMFETLTSLYNRKKHFEELTVLDNVSFTVKKGEMIGIIGLNGSGKSTLLRIIAGIYSPNKGKIITRGNTIPFLELGTGFQPDLTAKENIFLYGLILGFTAKQIKEKIDEIIKYAGLENFADTKIKNFSSGMYARLAFSTAIQVDPDILVVDEVLSVGDLPFQQKSFETFLSFKKRGKSIILVSHNLDLVKSLCDRAIFIHKGRIYSIGKPEVVINAYRNVVDNMSNIEQLKNRIKDPKEMGANIDEEIFSHRPWIYDYSTLGVNTGLELISIPPTKNQKFTEPIITSYLKKAFENIRNERPTLLDMFCIDGFFSIYAAKTFKCGRILAIDNDQNNVERAKLMNKKLNVDNVEIRLQDPHTLDEQESFDVVLNLYGLHMVSDPENVLKTTHKITKQFALIHSVVTLENVDPDYFETPAPGWTWGCRFTETKISKWIESLDWDIIAHDRNVLEENAALHDRGSVYFLCKKRTKKLLSPNLKTDSKQ
jgi:ABC-type polysaccharide/polyol phosphate transport system ATPase subunit